MGSAPMELTNRSTYLFATEVMPHLRPIWGEYEDHWWPKALPAAERVAAGSYNTAVRATVERPSHDGGEPGRDRVRRPDEVRP